MEFGQRTIREDSPYECTKRRIVEVLRHSSVPEDFEHGFNTLKWVKRIMPEADVLMEIAALGHDIERAIEEKKVRREDFPDYEAFKDAHAKNSADIVRSIMQECGWDEQSIGKVARMVRLHETGGDEEADILRDADALSFFDVNLPYYFQRHDLAEVERRCRWGYSRISPSLRYLVKEMRYSNEQLNRLVNNL
ncbi:MAG: hypothetical protein DRH15_15130 [Deltaproteobacteria bacterium]|nr:MAG: hypothetical protein DRH15_15130 [Deltaproteobacteria bacterium]